MGIHQVFSSGFHSEINLLNIKEIMIRNKKVTQYMVFALQHLSLTSASRLSSVWPWVKTIGVPEVFLPVNETSSTTDR
jgi:hypothetical protein